MVAKPALLFCLLLLVPLAVPPSFAADAVPSSLDPLDPGPWAWERLTYDFGHTVVFGEPVQPYLVRLRGSVHVPIDAPPAKVIVFMHGRHATCAALGIEFLVPQCQETAATEIIRSYDGYDHMATNLASHGYAVISLDANHVNDVDIAARDAGGRARGELVLRTLDAFITRNDTGVDPDDGIGDRLVGRLDFARVGLMGHSRGGEGVVQAALQDLELGRPYNISAVFSLAPIDAMGSAVGHVPLAVLLPYCDGDVFDLSGARIYDASRYLDDAPKHQFLFLGANHNWFNSEWRGDDSGNGDGFCRGGSSDRLSMAEQRALGLIYINGFLRTYIGGETAFLPYLTGAAALPDGVCPLQRFPRTCAEEVHVSYHAPDRLVIEDGAGSPQAANDLGGDSTIFGADLVASYRCEGSGCPLTPTRGSADQLALWQNAGITYHTVFPPQDVSSYDAFSFRAAFDGMEQQPVVHVTLRDALGSTATVMIDHPAVYVPPGSSGRDFVLNTVRVPLQDFGAVDVTQIHAVTLSFDIQPSRWVQVADVMFAGTAADQAPCGILRDAGQKC